MIEVREGALVCRCEGPCFGRADNSSKVCLVLNEAYKNDKCPFQKRDARYTKGKYYPYVNVNAYKAADKFMGRDGG